MPCKIPLVDDDQDDALFFSDALQQVDPAAILHHAISTPAALDLLVNGEVQPDVIFLDLNMPGPNGWECLREIKIQVQHRHIPIIMYSTANLHSSGFDPGDVGAIAFYQKTTSFAQLKKDLIEMLSLVGH